MGEAGIQVEKSENEAGRVANPGDYESSINASCFRSSRLMRAAAEYIESGKFEEGLQLTLDGIKKRGIQLARIPQQEMMKGTERPDGKTVMVLPDYFETQHPAKKLWSLLHRNMSLILQRMGKRDDPQFMKQLFDMDIAYAQSLRLGATNIPNDQRKVVEELANDIDGDSRAKMART